MNNKILQLSVATGLLASAAAIPSANAQSSDAIIDKLVEKGILTVKEANDLRDEADKSFNSAYQVKSGMPDWVTSLRLNGDFRGRYEGFYSDPDNMNFVDRNRFRYRARFGAIATIKDNFEVGLRLTSSERNENFGGDPISGNTTFSDNGSKKFIFLDLAYGKWTPLNNADWTGAFTVGKMENPFVLSDMVFDADYTPEGFGQQLSYNLNSQHALKMNLGEFMLEEVGNSSNDAYLFGAQVRFDSTWNTKLQSTFGVTGLAVSGEDSLSTLPLNVPNVNRGNTRTPIPTGGAAGGDLVYEYNPIVVDGAVTYTLESFPMYNAAFPIRVGGEFMHNPAADDNNNGWSVGVTFGKSGKKGLWDVSYRYKVLEADAWYEELVDSDFGAFYGRAFPGAVPSGSGAGYAAGTNVKGHIFKASYSPYDSLTFGITYFLTELVDENPTGSDSDMGRLQLDAVWKF